MKDITKAEIEKFFGSVQAAIDFHELGQRIQTKELLQSRTWKWQDFFKDKVSIFATNNAPLQSLMSTFQSDYIKTIESQIVERAKLISHLKTLL